MEFKGRIYKVMPITEGVNRAGDKWQKQEFLFEYFEHDTDRYTDKVALSIMNERIKECDLHEGEEVTIGFGHTVREYQGRYYNDIRCYKIEKAILEENQNNLKKASDIASRLEAMQKRVEEMQITGTNTAQEATQEKKDNLPF
jgi:hypothetical protein